MCSFVTNEAEQCIDDFLSHSTNEVASITTTLEFISMTLNSFTYFIFLEYSLDGIDVYYVSLYFSGPSHVFG